MAITDNTAKWRVKKLTNFTDKEREIATQAQAEEGVDNTKVMTPLRTKNAIDKQRPLKTFTSLEQMGLGSNASEADVGATIPVGCILKMTVIRTQYPNFILEPKSIDFDLVVIGGARTIFYAQNTNGVNFVATYRKWNAEFRGWKQLATTDDIPAIATQSEAEAGTSNATVMTPLRTKNAIDKQRPLKTFTSLEQLGLDNNASEADIANSLPSQSELRMVLPNYSGNYPNLTMEKSDGFFVVKRAGGTQNVHFEFVVYSANDKPKIFKACYTSWLTKPFSGWRKLAYNGALSMPSYSKGFIETYLSITENSANLMTISNAYIAPCDGWLKFIAVGGTGSGIKEAKVWTNADVSMSYFLPSGSTTNGVFMEFFVPVAKGDVVNLSYRNIKSLICRFIYAQSEV